MGGRAWLRLPAALEHAVGANARVSALLGGGASRRASAAQLADLAQRWLRDADARRAKTDEGAAWAVRNAAGAHFLDDLIESYWEVVREPCGEGLVGKRFPWSFEATCRGERWCRTPAKKIRPHWAQ